MGHGMLPESCRLDKTRTEFGQFGANVGRLRTKLTEIGHPLRQELGSIPLPIRPERTETTLAEIVEHLFNMGCVREGVRAECEVRGLCVHTACGM